jgi:hypothetical protein
VCDDIAGRSDLFDPLTFNPDRGVSQVAALPNVQDLRRFHHDRRRRLRCLRPRTCHGEDYDKP